MGHHHGAVQGKSKRQSSPQPHAGGHREEQPPAALLTSTEQSESKTDDPELVEVPISMKVCFNPKLLTILPSTLDEIYICLLAQARAAFFDSPPPGGGAGRGKHRSMQHQDAGSGACYELQPLLFSRQARLREAGPRMRKALANCVMTQSQLPGSRDSAFPAMTTRWSDGTDRRAGVSRGGRRRQGGQDPRQRPRSVAVVQRRRGREGDIRQSRGAPAPVAVPRAVTPVRWRRAPPQAHAVRGRPQHSRGAQLSLLFDGYARLGSPSDIAAVSQTPQV